MKICHPRCVELLQEMFFDLKGHSWIRAIDIGGGDGRLACSLLLDRYGNVDLVDQCP